MKRSLRLLCLLLLLILAASLMLPALAAEYTYTVRLYAGDAGTIRGQTVLVYTGLHYGDRVRFPIEDVEVNDGKYYVKGFRESGRDNSAVGPPSFAVTKDQDFVVAYGVRGELVSYTVRYLTADGTPLAPDATGYGNVGDKPVIGFRYFDGYRPRAYNLTKTLSENEAENLFVFYYDKLKQAAAQLTEAEPAAPAEAGPAQPSAADAESSAEGLPSDEAAADASPGDERSGGASGLSTPGVLRDAEEPIEILDLDPQTSPDEAAAAVRSGLPVWGWCLIGLAVLSLAALLLLLLRRRKRD